MRTLLWAVGVLAIEVLLLWGYFAVVGVGRIFQHKPGASFAGRHGLVGGVARLRWRLRADLGEATTGRGRVHHPNVCGAGGGSTAMGRSCCGGLWPGTYEERAGVIDASRRALRGAPYWAVRDVHPQEHRLRRPYSLNCVE
jgi:hypothetical protein